MALVTIWISSLRSLRSAGADQPCVALTLILPFDIAIYAALPKAHGRIVAVLRGPLFVPTRAYPAARRFLGRRPWSKGILLNREMKLAASHSPCTHLLNSRRAAKSSPRVRYSVDAT